MGQEHRNRWLGRLRLLGVYLFVGLLTFFSRPTPASLVAGVIFLLAGEGVRIWAAGHLVKSVRMITSGPYAYVQHPLYLGRLLILTGLCTMARMDHLWNLWILAGAYALFFLYYFPRKLRVEGDRLRERHGSVWDSYAESVPPLFPSLRRYPGSREMWSLRRALGNQEYLVLTGLAVVFVLFLMKWGMR